MTDDRAWADLRRFTPARIALGRVGAALPTRAVLDLALAHALARDAVHQRLDLDRLEADARGGGYEIVRVASAAPDRATYLARPDLGRRLSEQSRAVLASSNLGAGRPGESRDPASKAAAWTPVFAGVSGTRDARPDLALVIADGLSAPAAQAHAVPLLATLRPWLAEAGLATGPVVLATQARVALGDEIAAALGARAVLVLIGERPGLSAPDSLGAYLTFAPRPGGTVDAERNCLSNIRPAGLSAERAAVKLAWLIGQAFARGLTGVGLKDESDRALLGAEPGRLGSD